MTHPVKETPEVNAEMDIPPSEFADAQLSADEPLENTITKFKYATGRRLLYISMAVMVLAVAAGTIISCVSGDAEHSMLNSLFEVFKLIAMTVLGYIFGSNGQGHS